jgi:hypothetical protein
VLKLRRGVVVAAGDAGEPMQELEVDVDGVRRAAIADVGLVGPAEQGDEVIVNVEARDLALGSGGFDVVHANLTRGLAGEGVPGAHVMKLNYTSLQHAVLPVEEEGALEEAVAAALPVEEAEAPEAAPEPELGPPPGLPLGRPVAVISLHGQLPPLAWALAQAAPGARLGYVQTAGGALPGALSRVVRELRSRDLLAGHITAGPAYGGEGEAITTAGAIHHGLLELGWDAVVCGPGPGILGSGSPLGHGGMAALDSLHSALALGCPALVAPRMSSGDPRPRHRGLSHHTATVLSLALGKAVVALPEGERPPAELAGRHEWRSAEADVEGYAGSGLPARSMGRSIDEDRLFFAAALAAGAVLGRMVRER